MTQYYCNEEIICSYRIDRAMRIGTLIKDHLKRNNVISKKLINGIDMHRTAIRFSDLFLSKFKVMFSLVIVVGVICLSTNIFRVYEAVSSKRENAQTFLPVFFVGSLILYLFMSNFVGQQVIDYNNHVFFTAYNVKWYLAPMHIQRMILFLLQRSMKIYCLNLGVFFVGSMEGAASLMSTTLSYFTVLYSTQQ